MSGYGAARPPSWHLRATASRERCLIVSSAELRTDEGSSGPPLRTGPRLRLGYLDGVRAVAAGYVVLHHIWITLWPDYPRNSGPWWTGWLLYGHLAVSVFIVVSGFSLSLQPVRHKHRLRGGVPRFARRRAWRIIPPYWAALAVSALMLYFVTGPRDLVTVKGIVVHALLLQDVIGSPSPNGAFWSIAVEWQIYFAFPLLLWWRRRFGLWSTIVCATLLVSATYVGADYVDLLRKTQDLTPQFLVLFVLGMAGAEVTVTGLKRPWARVNMVVAASGAALALLAYAVIVGSEEVDRQYFWVDLVAGGCTALLIAGLAGGQGRVLCRALSHRFLRFLGQFSYSTYLMHLPLLAPVWVFFLDPLPLGQVAKFLIFLLVGLPTVYVGSWLFSIVFEQPFIRHRSFGELVEASVKGLGVRGVRFGRKNGWTDQADG